MTTFSHCFLVPYCVFPPSYFLSLPLLLFLLSVHVLAHSLPPLTVIPPANALSPISQFIDKLHSDRKCTELIRDLLVLIKQDMPLVDGTQWITTDCVAEKLDRLQRQADLWWNGYFTDSAPWTASR